MSSLGDDFYSKYFSAYDAFRAKAVRPDSRVVNLDMVRAAKVLSDTPLSTGFYEAVKGIDEAHRAGHLTDDQCQDRLEAHARDALVKCGQWHLDQVS